MANTGESLTKITINIYSSDLDALKAFYRRTGYQRAVRLLLRKHCRELQRKQDNILQEVKGSDLGEATSKS